MKEIKNLNTVKVLKTSSIYETEPVGFKDQNWFLNAVIKIKTKLKTDSGVTALANSITLTPGTITISVEPEKGMFRVHGIAKEPADALLVGPTMQKKVA